MIVSATQLLLFSAASLILIFTPGPDIIYVMTRGMAQGRRAALAAAAGFGLGNFVHTFFAIAGLSALLASSSTAFAVVKYAGALYLVYLGIKMVRSNSGVAAEHHRDTLSCATIFRQSIVANVLNPKVAVFFLAFFPQFIDSGKGHVSLQMLVLGSVFVVLTILGFGVVGLGSGVAGELLRRRPGAGIRLGQISGAILVSLGLRLAWPEGR